MNGNGKNEIEYRGMGRGKGLGVRGQGPKVKAKGQRPRAKGQGPRGMNGDAKGGMRIGNEGTGIEKEEWESRTRNGDERGRGMGMRNRK